MSTLRRGPEVGRGHREASSRASGVRWALLRQRGVLPARRALAKKDRAAKAAWGRRARACPTGAVSPCQAQR